MNKPENCPFCSKKLKYEQANNFSIWSSATCYMVSDDSTHHFYSWSDFDRIESLDYFFNKRMLVIQIWFEENITQITYGDNGFIIKNFTSMKEIISKMENILLLS